MVRSLENEDGINKKPFPAGAASQRDGLFLWHPILSRSFNYETSVIKWALIKPSSPRYRSTIRCRAALRYLRPLLVRWVEMIFADFPHRTFSWVP